MREIAWRDVKTRVTAAVERLFVVEVDVRRGTPKRGRRRQLGSPSHGGSRQCGSLARLARWFLRWDEEHGKLTGWDGFAAGDGYFKHTTAAFGVAAKTT